MGARLEKINATGNVRALVGHPSEKLLFGEEHGCNFPNITARDIPFAVESFSSFAVRSAALLHSLWRDAIRRKTQLWIPRSSQLRNLPKAQQTVYTPSAAAAKLEEPAPSIISTLSKSKASQFL